MRRFWTDVTIVDHAVFLDGKPVRTPGRAPLMLPSDALAEAVAAEWRGVDDALDPRAMPLTGLANAAIDRVAPDPAAFAAGLARYGESDLLCYRADSPADLVVRQAAAWNPPLAWAQARYDVHVAVTVGIIHVAQPAATIARLAEAVAAQGSWTLAGLSPIVTITGSLILALALSEQAMDANAVWDASRLDETWQAEQWGEDPLAAQAIIEKRRDFDAAVQFLATLGG